MYMDTNSGAALYFHRAILPLIWRERPEVRLLIVGKNPPRSVVKLREDPRITVTGTVPDIRPYLWQASVGIDPVRMAAGMQNKLIEGLAAGLPMVISPEANEGIHAPEGSALLVGRTPEEFASHVIWLLNNRQRAQAIATAGLEFVRAQWSWEHHFRCLEQKLEGILAERVYASA
jgi:glycosyltransferase involved in cell wall biosynthesis